MKRNTSKLYLIITIIYFVFMAIVSFWGPSFVRSISPKVQTASINGGNINNSREYHKQTVPNNAIFHEDEKSYMYIMRTKRTFWLEGTYSIKVWIEIVDSDERKTAITSKENITSLDYVICKSDKKLKDGGRVFNENRKSASDKFTQIFYSSYPMLSKTLPCSRMNLRFYVQILPFLFLSFNNY